MRVADRARDNIGAAELTVALLALGATFAACILLAGITGPYVDAAITIKSAAVQAIFNVLTAKCLVAVPTLNLVVPAEPEQTVAIRTLRAALITRVGLAGIASLRIGLSRIHEHHGATWTCVSHSSYLELRRRPISSHAMAA
jgi:hypothetical protein